MNWSKLREPGRWKELLSRYRAILLVLAAGLLLMLMPTGEGEEQPSQTQTEAEERFVLEEFEKKLADTLSQIQGAGKSRVMLTLKGGSRQILAQDAQRDGNRLHTSAVILGKGSSTQTVVPLQTLGPEFQGAVVVCQGGDDPAVRLRLSAAVSALTGLGSDRILICKGT